MKCSLDWVRVSHLYIFHLKEKPPPEKFIKIKFNQMAQITSAKTKLIFSKVTKKCQK